MLNLNSLMIGTMQPKVMASFYEKIFDKKPDMVDGEWSGWQVGACFFTVGEHSEAVGPSKDPARIMFTLETPEVQTEFTRMKALGATVVKEPYEMTEGDGYYIATLADPDGNYFQLMMPWNLEDMKK
ncbi:MAG: VOC family protein [Weeksellaceae bacterium]